MSALDWTVLFGALACFVAYGVWRGRGERDLTDFLLAGRSMRWPMVALSVMATQASAITFLSTPGQGYADGLRFVQFYFGLPLAMVVLCITAIPLYHRLRVFTAYEFLERRFGPGTRTLAATLFLIQRGLAAGLTIYAPALVLSVILGWDVRWTCVLLGGLVVLYTTSGGSKAVGHSHVLQFSIIMATMVVAFAMILASLPAGVGVGDAAWLAARLGRMNALQLHFDPDDRYNLWSGLIGGFFLQLSYFGTDQSQVGRYLTGRSVAQSRLGLVFNGLVKVPMQLGILSLGVLVFVFYLFVAPPLFFNPAESARLASGEGAAAWRTLEDRHHAAAVSRAAHARELLAARHRGAAAAEETAARALREDQRALGEARQGAAQLIRAHDPGGQTSDTNYVFLVFVLGHLPVGLIGLVFAAVFAASMNSTSAELNALASTTVVDVVKRLWKRDAGGRRDVWVSRLATLGWAAVAVGFAETCSRLGSLIEAVNILGSLFYGTILGIFLTAFYLPRVGGSAVFTAALVAEAAVIACFRLSGLSFLWYNLIGCALVVLVALALEPFLGRRRAAAI
ncbi:MAG: sodium:solute symporter [Candidatus Eisenbacteria bacterium]|nr:sodium:solute symporter [Candidatus Eisenbacteria bacterium]